MVNTIGPSDSIEGRNRVSERCRGATGLLYNQSILFAIVLIALLVVLSGCGSGQSDVGQINGNSVPVNLNISMPQESAAASTRGSRFWATVQSWLPSLTSAWAQQGPTSQLADLRVDVTDSSQQPLATSSQRFSQPPESGDTVTFDLNVPAGPDRVFTVSGLDGAGRTILQGKSNPTTLIEGQAASVDVTLTPIANTGTVIGTVTNAGTGTTLSNATVAVTGTSLRTTTNSAGEFGLDGVPEGSQTLSVSASGFFNTTKVVPVVAGASISAGTIALRPFPTTGTVTGTVTNAGTGTPLPNATLSVIGTNLSTITDRNGNFTLTGVPQGPQTLTVSAAGFTSTTRAVPPVVAGQSVSTGTIALTPIQTTGSIIGRVVNGSTQKPLTAGQIIRVAGSTIFARTRDDGSFTLEGVSPGPQIVQFNITGFQETTRTVEVNKGQSVDVGTVAMKVRTFTGTLVGKVVVEGTRAPIPGATVLVTILNLNKKPTDKFFQGKTIADGTFTISDVTEGFITITVTASGFTKKTIDGSVKEREVPSNAGEIALIPEIN